MSYNMLANPFNRIDVYFIQNMAIHLRCWIFGNNGWMQNLIERHHHAHGVEDMDWKSNVCARYCLLVSLYDMALTFMWLQIAKMRRQFEKVLNDFQPGLLQFLNADSDTEEKEVCVSLWHIYFMTTTLANDSWNRRSDNQNVICWNGSDMSSDPANDDVYWQWNMKDKRIGKVSFNVLLLYFF